jgi:hypothetical protein
MLNVLITHSENDVSNVSSDDEGTLLMLVKDEIINRLDDEMDEISEEMYSDDSEKCAVSLQASYDKLEREHSRVCSRYDLQGLRHMGYSIQEL